AGRDLVVLAAGDLDRSPSLGADPVVVQESLLLAASEALRAVGARRRADLVACKGDPDAADRGDGVAGGDKRSRTQSSSADDEPLGIAGLGVDEHTVEPSDGGARHV